MVNVNHPRPPAYVSENLGPSREPREARVMACDSLGYLQLGTAGLGLKAEAGTSLIPPRFTIPMIIHLFIIIIFRSACYYSDIYVMLSTG